MSWRRERQFSIVLVLVIVVGVLAGSWYYFKRPEPSCFDGRKNQDEIGPDCGGVCARVCSVETKPLAVLWARPIEITAGNYSAVAFIENPNENFGVPVLAYDFSLVDKEGNEIARRSGRSFANPKERFLVFESGIVAPAGMVARAFLEFPSNQDWGRENAATPGFSVRRKSFEAVPAPRLVAEAVNSSVRAVRNIFVPVVISDKDGNAITASATYIDSLPAGETKELYYTWPLPFLAEPVFFDFYPHQNIFGTK